VDAEATAEALDAFPGCGGVALEVVREAVRELIDVVPEVPDDVCVVSGNDVTHCFLSGLN
jgi:hypothetical protein